MSTLPPTGRAVELLHSSTAWRQNWEPIARHHASQADTRTAAVRALARELRMAYRHHPAVAEVDWDRMATVFLAVVETGRDHEDHTQLP